MRKRKRRLNVTRCVCGHGQWCGDCLAHFAIHIETLASSIWED